MTSVLPALKTTQNAKYCSGTLEKYNATLPINKKQNIVKATNIPLNTSSFLGKKPIYSNKNFIKIVSAIKKQENKSVRNNRVSYESFINEGAMKKIKIIERKTGGNNLNNTSSNLKRNNIIANNNITQTENETTTNMLNINNQKRVIPQKIHFIWLGNNPIPQDAISNIINAWKKNPHYKIYLWTNNSHKLEKDILNAGISKAILQKVEIKQPHFPHNIEAAIARECTENDFANYAAASDIMRLAILKDHGGIYLDVDVALKRPFGYLTCQNNLTDCLFYLFNNPENTKYSVSNGAIAAPEGSQIIKKILESILFSYKLHRPTLGYDHKKHFNFTDDKGRKKTISIDDLMWEEKRKDLNCKQYGTMSVTGPSLLFSYLTKTYNNSNIPLNINLFHKTKSIGYLDKFSFADWREITNNFSIEQKKKMIFGQWNPHPYDSGESWLDKSFQPAKISEI